MTHPTAERLRAFAAKWAGEPANPLLYKMAALGIMHEAAAEFDSLYAIVERLPKTADGAPVVPGIKLYYRHNRKDVAVVDEQWVNNNLNLQTSEPEHLPGVYCWYSTREAALRDKP